MTAFQIRIESNHIPPVGEDTSGRLALPRGMLLFLVDKGLVSVTSSKLKAYCMLQIKMEAPITQMYDID